MKKVIQVLAILFVTSMIGSSILIMSNDRETVEKYCAVAYRYDVQEYKSCIKLDRTKLIEKLTKEANKQDEGVEVPNLPELK